MTIFGYKISKLAVVVFIVIVFLIFLSNLIMKQIAREPEWLVERNRLANEEKIRTSDWQIYKNDEYYFKFQNPPMTKVDDCIITDCSLSVVFGSENYKELYGIKNANGPTRKYFMGIMVKTSPLEVSLKEYVENQKNAIKNISLSNREALGKDLNVDWIVKTSEIENIQGYVIETVNYDDNTPSRRFFIPLKNNQLLVILEVGRNIDDILSKFVFN
ncbi:hypothetical protein A3D77_01645 [Candidatus Gottesmanbacteria bacterium RIFCSPHIGHO2_02_FULL_39_11]|uniref:Uncharacterized protein n=1 Tax=Candidatus Gottesmanbacteria bacterium RIFCSPHIGHO2_02_FULL_39_11 TaxID=1798382 RepID=A0A1F5ZTG4_9BACT|nr:MAG: hypothetical protein A3D77_01645 [Candidatus Gottesmanbacteria bacterium RIFCSPHIGHO2_02_FULL_39_11]